jgi:hypothetical protein
MEKEGTDMEKLVYILCQEGYNKQGALASILTLTATNYTSVL